MPAARRCRSWRGGGAAGYGLAGGHPANPPSCNLVTVEIRLVRTLDRNADVVSLRLRQLGELRADLGEMETSDLLIEMLRQRVNLRLVLRRVVEQLDLRDHLVRERRRH